MLMMMRSDDSYTPSTNGCTAEQKVDCMLNADDYDACIAACSGNEEENTDPEEVKAGTLNVTMTSEEGGEFPSRVSSLPVVTYTLKAADEDINVTSLVIEEGGYATPNKLNAALYIDWQRVSKVKRLAALDTKYTLSLTSAYTIKAGKSVDIELRVSDISNPGAAQQFNIKLADVNSSAEKVKLPSNVKSNTFKLIENETVTLTVTAPSALENPKAGSKGAELFEIKLAGNNNQDVEFNSITLLGEATAPANAKDLADYLENVKLVLDGEVLAEWKLNGKYLTFNLKNAYTIEKGKTATFTVKADVLGWAGKTFNYALEDVMDLSATAVAYNAPVRVVNTPDFSDFEISAGRVVIERTNPSSNTFTKNRTNLYLGSFTITDNNGSDLNLKDFTLRLTKWAWANVSTYVDAVKVRYGSNTAGLVEWTCDALEPMECTFDDEQSIGKSYTVYVYADIKDNVDVSADSFALTAPVITIEENENNVAVLDKSMPGSWMTMIGSASSMNVTNVKLSNEEFTKWEENVEAVSFKVKTNSTEGVKIKKLTFNGVDWSTVQAVAAKTDFASTAAATAAATAINAWTEYTAVDAWTTVTITQVVAKDTPAAWWTLTVDWNVYTIGTQWVAWALNSNTIRNASLFVGDKEYSATISANTIKVTNTITLDKDTTTTFTLKVDIASNPTVTPFTYSLVSYEAEDTSADKNDLSVDYIAWINGRAISIADKWTLSITSKATATANKYAKSILAGTTADVMEYTLKASYEDLKVVNWTITLDLLWLTTNELQRIEDIQLVYGDEIVASDATLTTTTATFNNVNFDITTTETPLIVKVVTKKMTNNADYVAQWVYVDGITFTQVYGKVSGNLLTLWLTNTSDSKVFDVVPATVTATVKEQTASKAVLLFSVNKWDNTKTSSNPFDLSVNALTLDVTANNKGLSSLTIKNGNGVTIYNTTNNSVACTAGDTLLVTKRDWTNALCLHKVNAAASDYDIEDGTEYTFTYMVWDANTPSFTVDLTDVEVANTYTDATLLSNRMETALPLLNK